MTHPIPGPKRPFRTLIPAAVAAALILAPVPTPAGAQTPGGEEAEALREGLELLLAEDFKGATRAFEKADRIAGGRSAQALLGLTIAHNHRREAKKAIAAAGRVLDLTEDPKLLARVHQELGAAYLTDGQYNSDQLEKAAEHYRLALEHAAGKSAEAHFGLATTYFEQAQRSSLKQRPEAFAEMTEQLVEALKDYGEDPRAGRARQLLCGGPDCTPADYALGGSCGLQLPAEHAGTRPIRELQEIEGERVAAPVKVSDPPPDYPEAARRSRVVGLVIVKSVIDKEGKVRHPWVVHGLPLGLSEAAVKAIETWRFEPATLDGEPVSVFYNLSVNFHLQ